MDKWCPDCRTLKTVTAFAKNATNKDGLRRVCRECMSAYSRKYYLANADGIRRRSREYNANNIDQKRAASRRYYLANKSWLSKLHKAYVISNADKISAYMAKYHSAYTKTSWGKATRKASGHKRRAAKAKRGLPRSHPMFVSGYAIEFIFAMWDHTCPACGSTDKLALEHTTPIARGGEHSVAN